MSAISAKRWRTARSRADEFSQAIMQIGMTETAQQAAESVETIEGAMGNLKATIVDTMAAILHRRRRHAR